MDLIFCFAMQWVPFSWFDILNVMSLTSPVLPVGLGDMAKKIFSYQLISIIITINVKSLFLSSLKPEFCSKVKVVETRPFIFLKINI